MKLLRLIPWCVFIVSPLLADDVFPGLQKVLTEAEWKRAGLDKLTPDQVGVIDAALIKHYHQIAKAPAVNASPAPSLSVPASATPAETAAVKSRFWDRFGLGKSSATPDWRTQPPMTAKVTAWRGANSFVLDNGQVWEGLESIPYELLGNTVTIEARPLDSFALKLNADSVAVRVRRVK